MGRRFAMAVVAVAMAVAWPAYAGAVTAAASQAHLALPAAARAAAPATAFAQSSDGGTPAGGTWGQAQVLPGSTALSGGAASDVNAVSCAAVGSCSAAGSYYGLQSGDLDALADGEVNGAWGTAEEMPGVSQLISPSVTVASLSCASPGNCAAGGSYNAITEPNNSVEEAFLISETNGAWGAIQEVPGLDALDTGGNEQVTSVSCPAAGDCSAAGYYTDASTGQQAFVVSETDGTWGQAAEVSGMQSETISISCASPDNCAAVGGTFVVDESDGTWGTAEEPPGLDALNTDGNAEISSVSCAAAGDCTIGGGLADNEAFVADESDGTWGTAEEVPGILDLDGGDSAGITSISCPAPGECGAGGYYADGDGDDQAFVVSETSGAWGSAEEVPGTAAMSSDVYSLGSNTEPALSVSCPSAGNCSAGGYFIGDEDGEGLAFLVNETDGTWGQAVQVQGPGSGDGIADEIDSVSCAAAGYCSAGGTSGDGQPMVVNEATATTTSLAVSPASAPYGDEETLRLSASVGSKAGGTPDGQVMVTAGSTKVCVITLTSGTGSCKLSARQLSLGTHRLSAAYSGAAEFLPSASAAKVLRVTKPSATRVALSAARVTYEHENAEHVSVTVTSKYSGTPAGKVTVKAGKATICVITLRSGKGKCALSARKLRAGKYQIVAEYGGNSSYGPSASAKKTLKVRPAR